MADLGALVNNMNEILTEKERYDVINGWLNYGPTTYYNLVRQTEISILEKEKNMSRSYKKTPIFGNAHGESEKESKKRWHKAFRRKVKQTIHEANYDPELLDNVVFPDENEILNVISMEKDGKHYWNPKRASNKIVDYFKKLMRK
jgi:hypothetical protein